MTTLGGVEGLGFIPTIYANDTEYPDIQFHMAPASIASDDGIKVRKILGVQDSIYDRVFRPIAKNDAWTIMPLLLRPRSRGSIRLRSRDPMAYPYIDANYFDDPLDIATLVEGVKLAVKVSGYDDGYIIMIYRCMTSTDRVRFYLLARRSARAKRSGSTGRGCTGCPYPAARGTSSARTSTGNVPSATSA